VTWFETPAALCPSNWPQDIKDWYSPANDAVRAERLKDLTEIAARREGAA
jgi:hypothetical protein